MTRRPEDCEYTDKQGRTYTEILEERLSQLKARLQELESPRGTQDSTPVYLHNPYANRGINGKGRGNTSRKSSGETLNQSSPSIRGLEYPIWAPSKCLSLSLPLSRSTLTRKRL